MNLRTRSALMTFTLLGSIMLGEDPAREEDRAAKWEKNIVAIEKRLEEKVPPKDGIFFVGSSTIVNWNVAKSFPGLPVINVGFGGSEIRDSTLFASRILIKHHPKTIVFYAGDNDLNSKRTPEQVLADFKSFVKTIHDDLPKTRIIFLSIKPSPSRIKAIDLQKKTNHLVSDFCKNDEHLLFVDLFPLLLDSEGKPKTELFKEDELHLNPTGYEKLTAYLLPILKK